MPRKYYRRRKGFKKAYGMGTKPWYSRKYNALDIAKSAWKGVKFIKGLVNVEKHYIDTTGVANPGTGTINHVTPIQAGDDNNNRQGNSVLAKTLLIRATVGLNASSVMNAVRILVVKDLENTGSAPTPADILQSTGDVNSPMNVDHGSRYQVLIDKLFALDQNRSLITWKKFIPINDHIKYTGVNAADTYKNNIYMLMVSDASADFPTIRFWTRLGYYDN